MNPEIVTVDTEVERERIPVVYGGVSGSVSRTPQIVVRPRSLLVAGPIAPGGGQDLLIEALALLPKGYELTLLGSAQGWSNRRYWEKLQLRAERLGVYASLRATGEVEARLLSNYYVRTELVVLATETYASSAFVQAVSRASAMIARDIPEHRELGEREPGLWEYFKTPEELAQIIQSARENPARRLAWIQAARRYADRHRPETFGAPPARSEQ